ncbi:glycerol-3-phosphate 1-O-acyltransferase PlsY [Clostridium thermarum]|uniref:glycerol-3-phosphate 1-O-acyltransferase PlsY n=1 Tax=Clostridium thermarum TaxID=1716543 RepID=UPI001120A73F|nr:glycerol-3-phosphate 1-O-acyltransferase PlsY [Clostridium thermarum]
MILIITILISFLCGSIPSGYIITKKMCGIDIRTVGSGNIGSTNVKRVAGSKASIITQIIDVAKGVTPVVVSIYLYDKLALQVDKDTFLSMIAISAILGHNYTPFLKFKGGKGVNTTLGAFFFIAPIPTAAGIAIHFLLKVITSIVSIRSIATGIMLPLMCYILQFPMAITNGALIACVLMIIRHKDNIVRLINNQEI